MEAAGPAAPDWRGASQHQKARQPAEEEEVAEGGGGRDGQEH